MDQPQGHLIITGTGRAGTSFLVRYLTELGLDTHISRHGTAQWDDNANAGWEDQPIRKSAEHMPYVVKTPWISEYVDELLALPDFKVDVAVIPVRDLVEVAASRTIVELRAIHQHHPWMSRFDETWETWGRTPGGLVYSLNPLDQARILAIGFHRLVEHFVQADVPMVFLAYPRLVEDWEYLFERLKPHLPANTSADKAKAAHQRVAELEKLRVGKELQSAAGSQEPAAPVAGIEHRKQRELDQIAIRREIERLSKQDRELRSELKERTATAANLQAALNQYEAEIFRLRAALNEGQSGSRSKR